jgi:site-specific DNA recombinase
MLADVKRGHINALIFSKLARLARNTKELLEFSDYFRDHSADLISISETIDTSTPAGRLFFTIIAAMATWEREEIADRQKASILVRAKLGKPLNVNAPYGYQWKDRKLVVQPAEAFIRAKAFEMFLQYRRKCTVVRLLNAAGHRTRNKVFWGGRQLVRILTDPSAKGIYYFNRIHKNGAWKGTPKPESEWGKVECEPIVPANLWEQVNQLLEAQLKAYAKPGKLPAHVFGNLMWCGCGKKMYARADFPKFFCRACNRKIPSADLDAVVRKELYGFFGTPERVTAHLAAASQNLADKETAVAAHEQEIAKVREEMNRTHRLYQEGQITSQGFGQFYRPAEERLNQLLSELAELQTEVARLKVNKVSPGAVVEEARTLHERWPNLNTEQKRNVAEALVERIVIGDGEIDLTLSGLPTSEELCKTQQQAGRLRYVGCRHSYPNASTQGRRLS